MKSPQRYRLDSADLSTRYIDDLTGRPDLAITEVFNPGKISRTDSGSDEYRVGGGTQVFGFPQTVEVIADHLRCAFSVVGIAVFEPALENPAEAA